jgi:hypothetical protein
VPPGGLAFGAAPDGQGELAAAPVPPVDVACALDVFFTRSTGAYGVLIAAPERILWKCYSEFGSPDRAPRAGR